ncbi:MAG: formate dehydrogenase subunit gamma [Serpentinimonas sp.]|nr:formate dehydrogenase subunit gamma [Serpentinimonas sp.]
MPGGLLPLLHEVQAAFGYVPSSTVPRIARALGLSRAEVHGVISFYHDFRSQPPAQHRLRVCQAESCQAMGSQALTTALEQRLGCKLDQPRADGTWALESVYCLGLCAASPALMLDGQLHARVGLEQAQALIQHTEEQRA